MFRVPSAGTAFTRFNIIIIIIMCIYIYFVFCSFRILLYIRVFFFHRPAGPLKTCRFYFIISTVPRVFPASGVLDCVARRPHYCGSSDQSKRIKRFEPSGQQSDFTRFVFPKRKTREDYTCIHKYGQNENNYFNDVFTVFAA